MMTSENIATFKKRRKVSGARDYLMVILLFLPYFMPTSMKYASQVAFLSTIVYYWKIAACFVLFAYCTVYFFRHRIPAAVMFLGLMVTVMAVSTVLGGYSLFSLISSWFAYFVFVAGTFVFVKTRALCYLTTIRNWLIAMALINLVSMLVFPDGMPLDLLWSHSADAQLTWFWGFKNLLCSLLLPALFYCIAYEQYCGKQNTKMLAVVVIVALATAVLSKSSTLAISIAFVAFGYYLFRRLDISLVVNIRVINVLFVVLFVGLVFFSIQTFFGELIESLFDKDATLSSRTQIWTLSLEYLTSSPIIGLGVQGSDFVLLRFNPAFSHCHSALMTILFMGGYLGLASFIAFMFAATNGLWRARREYWARNMAMILMAYYIALLTGSISSVGVLSMLAVSMCYGEITKQREQNA